jgi:hypothetical protein
MNTTEQAIAAWKSGRAYWMQNERAFRAGRPNPGNYHVKLGGQSRGPIAVWNKAAKLAFTSVSALHTASQS